MPKPRDLTRPPITEAVFDIRVKSSSKFNPEDFKELQSILENQYPKIKSRLGRNFEFQVTGEGSAKQAIEPPELLGYIYESEDGKEIAQFRIDGFTFSRLRPYTSWTDYFPKAIRLWDLYRTSANPEVITRLALRYINHIPLESEGNLDDFLTAGPQVPNGLPNVLDVFNSTVMVANESRTILAKVTQALERNVRTHEARLLIDIDAYRQIKLPPGSNKLQPLIKEIREFKNRIFFSYLTEKTIGMFE